MTTFLTAAMWIVGLVLLVAPSNRSTFGFALGAAMASVGLYWTFYT